jgi:hypothetical protein
MPKQGSIVVDPLPLGMEINRGANRADQLLLFHFARFEFPVESQLLNLAQAEELARLADDKLFGQGLRLCDKRIACGGPDLEVKII